MSLRVGLGYDVHKLAENRPLILCGVNIPFEKGPDGHSDADVAVHAIMDAMLGAAGLGDIGQHFPDSDPRYKGISSLLLLAETKKIITQAGFLIVNIDTVIVAQAPKLAPYRAEMAQNIARVLEISENAVNIKATTEEGLGFTGSGLGISAQAICLLES